MDAENGKNGATSNGPETFTAEGAEDAENGTRLGHGN
jgi:hypothetical protein